MKILYFTDSLRCGGKERQLVELLKGLKREASIEVLLVCMDRGEFYEPEVMALETPIKYLIRKSRWDPLVLLDLYRLLKQFEPDVIHTNCMMTSGYALPVAKLLGIPMVNGSIRNSFRNNGVRWRIERLLLLLSDYRVANSAAGLSSRGFSASSPKNVVIHNGFDFSRLEALATGPANNTNNENNRPEVGMVAQFRSDKDFQTFVLAGLELVKRNPTVRFVAVGNGPTLATMRELASAAGDRFLFLGKQKEVERIISSFSVGVLATFTEGISNSIMEYMMLAKPVVATDCDGSRELVVDGKTGFLIPPRDPSVLADRIAYLLENPGEARRMGEAGRKHVEKHFGLSVMVDKTIKVYERAISSSRRGVRGATFRSNFKDAY